MSQRKFDFTGADGQKLSGLLDLPEGQAQAYALFAHCFTCNKNSLAAVRVARALTARGIGVLRFDFTGLGQSGGDFADSTFSGNVQDLVAGAAAMAAAGYPPQLLVGHSLGGAAVLAAAEHLPGIKAVATIAAPFDVQHVTALFGTGLHDLMERGEAQVNLGGRPFMMRRSFIDDLRHHDQGARIAQLHRALLVMHAPRDATVGIDNAGMIFQAARHPKSFITLDDADHLLTRPADAAYAADVISAWASRYLVSPAEDTPVAAPDGRVVVEETGAGRFQVAVNAGVARFLADEPVSVGGLGSGPSPYDLLAAGLGACTAMTLRMYAAQKNWPLARVRVAVDHDKARDRDPPDLFTREITLSGDLDEAQRARLLEIADRCPVHRTLEHGAKVATVAAMPAAPGGAADHVQAMEDICGGNWISPEG